MNLEMLIPPRKELWTLTRLVNIYQTPGNWDNDNGPTVQAVRFNWNSETWQSVETVSYKSPRLLLKRIHELSS